MCLGLIIINRSSYNSITLYFSTCRTIDYIVCNMGVYMRNNPVVLANLPMQIKNRILRKFTVSMHFLKGLDVTNTLPLFLHSRTKRVDLTCLTIDDNILQTLQPCLYLEEVFLTRKGVHSATSQGKNNN